MVVDSVIPEKDSTVTVAFQGVADVFQAGPEIFRRNGGQNENQRSVVEAATKVNATFAGECMKGSHHKAKQNKKKIIKTA